MNIKKIAKIVSNEKDLSISPLPYLKKALTVGMLKKELENLPDDCLIELEHIEKFNTDGTMSFTGNFLIAADTLIDNNDFKILRLESCEFQDLKKFLNER